jgi:hypothetical protein
MKTFPQNAGFSDGPHRRPQPNYSYREWLQHFERMGAKCYWCGNPLTKVTVCKDHVQPVSRFGTDTLDNVVPSCHPCNSMKGNKNEAEFLAWLADPTTKKRMGVVFVKGDSHNEFHRADCANVFEDYLEKTDRAKLAKLRQESEGCSWAWRNPAREA